MGDGLNGEDQQEWDPRCSEGTETLIPGKLVGHLWVGRISVGVGCMPSDLELGVAS